MKTQLIAALDTRDIDRVKFLVKELKGLVYAFKIGPELFLSHGIKSLEYIDAQSGRIFLDLKFFDIPSIVEKAAGIVTRHNIVMFTMHILGGRQMLSRTVNYIKSLKKDVMPLGVTVLTSMSEEDIREAGFNCSVSQLVLSLAETASECGVEGLVCSVRELDILKEKFKNNLKFVTPGIRTETDSGDDQVRTETPLEASRRGSDFIVMGRSLLNSPDPGQKAEEVLEQLWKRK